MKVAVQGTKSFDDYNVFMRSMAVAMSELRRNETITVYSVGPHKINSFVAGFVNLSENGMKARGMSIKYYRVAETWLEKNLDSMDYFVFLSKPKEPYSRLLKIADQKGLETGVFRY